MQIKTAEYKISSPSVALCPAGDTPEYAFIGRSNVGKSSLINMLTGHSRLAKTSAVPGKTVLINHFLINREWYLVDLPGYGYAKRSKTQQERFDSMIRSYILLRRQMMNLFLLVDARLEPQRVDLEFMEWLGSSSVPFSIVFTKADKLSKSALAGGVRAYLDRLSEQWEELPPHFVTSAGTGMGRDEVLDYIDKVNKSL